MQQFCFAPKSITNSQYPLRKLPVNARVTTDFLCLPQVAAINAEIVDSAMAMKTLTHFFLGLTNEWLESMSSIIAASSASSSSSSGNADGSEGKTDNTQGNAAGAAPKDSFPIQVSREVRNIVVLRKEEGRKEYVAVLPTRIRTVLCA